MKTKPHESRDCACAECEKWRQWVEGEEDGWRPGAGGEDGDYTYHDEIAPIDVYNGPTVVVRADRHCFPFRTNEEFKINELVAYDEKAGLAVHAKDSDTFFLGRAEAWYAGSK